MYKHIHTSHIMNVVAYVSMADSELTVSESNDLSVCARLLGPEGGLDRELRVELNPIDGTAVRK